MARDHPRSRGEYISWFAVTCCTHGSSPLSRGIHAAMSESGSERRIIPALAGNTHADHVHIYLDGDHPRSRGEYIPAFCHARRRMGSSPLSRGIRLVPLIPLSLGRIIPALAGNTGGLVVLYWDGRDHPRSRGEYSCGRICVRGLGGSSPLSRGIHGNQCTYQVSERIIPALAGNTRTACRTQPQPPDHPRSRGEYYDAALESLYDAGSSPLSRGIPLKATTQPTPPGIIPALAGNTRFLDW